MYNRPNPHSDPCRFFGCDVGKTTLVFSQHGQCATIGIANRKSDIEAFAARLDARCLLVCEATGGHETLLLDVVTAMALPRTGRTRARSRPSSARTAFSARPMPCPAAGALRKRAS
jgi:hypothetical protein